jgi:hypothetical protein
MYVYKQHVLIEDYCRQTKSRLGWLSGPSLSGKKTHNEEIFPVYSVQAIYQTDDYPKR